MVESINWLKLKIGYLCSMSVYDAHALYAHCPQYVITCCFREPLRYVPNVLMAMSVIKHS